MKVISTCLGCGNLFWRRTGCIILCPVCIAEKENAMLNHCFHCGRVFCSGKFSWQFIEIKVRQCMYCGKVTGMSNIKITAEVDGKQVPLNTISTESFEAIKALEKPKEIPVARVGNMGSADKRLILRIDSVLRKFITEHKDISMIAIKLEDGRIMHWGSMGIYSNIKPL